MNTEDRIALGQAINIAAEMWRHNNQNARFGFTSITGNYEINKEDEQELKQLSKKLFTIIKELQNERTE